MAESGKDDILAPLLQEVKNELNVFNADNEKPAIKDTNENIFGNLLTFLRTKNYISLLSAMREANGITVDNGNATIYVKNKITKELISFEKNKQQLNAFFKTINLSFNVELDDGNIEKSKIEKMYKLFGEKLIIIGGKNNE